MKTLIPLATLLLGIAIGWLAKPDPTPPLNPATSKNTPSSPSGQASIPPEQARPAKTERSRPTVEPEEDEDSGVQAMSEEEGQQAMNQMRQAAVERFRKKLEQYLAALDSNLALTPAQRAQVQAAIEAQLAEITKIMNSDGGDSHEVLDKLPELGLPALEAALAASLSPEQKTALETYKSKERSRQADTKALKKLALLQGIVDFKEGQRDEVYRILSDSAAASLAKTDATGVSTFSDVFSGFSGMDMDPYELGVQQLMLDSAQELRAGNAGTGDEKGMMKAFREKVDQLIEDRVSELKPVLDEAQLEKYREELRTKGLGPYGAMLYTNSPGE